MKPKQEEDDSFLIETYCKRLRLGPPAPHLPPTRETLCLLTERHLQYIPFTNLSMHSIRKSDPNNPKENDDEDPIVLMKDKLIQRLLLPGQGGGGCCLELNGLLACLLQALGFCNVRLVPCWVYAGRERGHASRKGKFRVQQSHFWLLVGCFGSGDMNSTTTTTSTITTTPTQQYLVDVGLGEPPIHPLRYSFDHLEKPQITPEGMKSRIRWDPRGPWVDGSGRKRTCLLLEWWRHDGWEPRLQWDIADAPLMSKTTIPWPMLSPLSGGPSIESFCSIIPILLHPKSSFARKLIV